MSTARNHMKQTHALKTASAGKSPRQSQSPITSNAPPASRRINGSDIVKEMRKRNSRKVETSILFFHPNIVTRPDSVSFKGVPADITRFIDERCREFDALRKELNEQWCTATVPSFSAHSTHDNSDTSSIPPPPFSPIPVTVSSTSTSIIRTTEELIQYMISSTYPYTVERPFLDCRHPDRFFYEPLLKLFYEVDDDAVVAVFPKLYKALYNKHFRSLGDIGPLRTRLCTMMHRLVGEFYGAEDLAGVVEKRADLDPMDDNHDYKDDHCSKLPSLYMLKSARVRLELGDRLDVRQSAAAAEEEEREEKEENTIVTIRPVTLYDVRYNYATFGRSNNNTHQYVLPFAENPFEIAFATAMVRLSELVPDEPSFNVAKDLGMISPTLWVDFVWWQDNVLRNAAYYQATQPYPWPPSAQQATVAEKTIQAVVYAYNLRTHPVLSALGDDDPLNRTAVLFFHPNATRSLDAICFKAVEARATALGQNTRECLCRQRRLDLLTFLDSLEHSLSINNNENHTMVSVGDLCRALGLPDRNDSSTSNTSFFGLLEFFHTHPTTALHTLETVVSEAITKNPFVKMQNQLLILIRHLIGDFYGAMPKGYRFDGRTPEKEDPAAVLSSSLFIPSLEQISMMSGWHVVLGEQVTVTRETETNTLVLKPLSLLSIRFRPDNFAKATTLESYFADSMVLLSMLVPDVPSFDRAKQLGVIDTKHLMIDWSWWELHVIQVAKYYAVDKHHQFRPPTAVLVKRLEQTNVHGTLRQQQQQQTPPALPVLTEKKTVIADIEPVVVTTKEIPHFLKQDTPDFGKQREEITQSTQTTTTTSAHDDDLLAFRFYYPDPRKIPSLMDERQIQEQCRVNLLQLLLPWYPTNTYRPAECERNKRALGCQHGSARPEEATKPPPMIVVLQDYHDVLHYAKQCKPIKVSFDPALRHFDPTPILQLFTAGAGDPGACFETLCVIHHWLEAVTPASEHLYDYDRLAQTLLGDFYGTLPCYYSDTLLEATKEGHPSPKLDDMPSLEDWYRAGFHVLAIVPHQRRGPSIHVDIELKQISVCQVTMLDLRYNKTLSRSSLLAGPATDSLLLLATLVPNPPSFRIAVETGMIPPTTLILDWSWWSQHVVGAAAATAVNNEGVRGHGRVSAGKETYQILCDMKHQYNTWKSQTESPPATSFLHRRWRDGAIGVLLIVILVLTLVHMTR